MILFKQKIYFRLISICSACMIFFFIVSIPIRFISNDKVSVLSMCLGIFLGSMAVAGYIKMYVSKYPYQVGIDNNSIIIYKIFREERVRIEDIIKIEEVRFMSEFIGVNTYEIRYKGGSIIFNMHTFTNGKDFIAQIQRCMSDSNRE